MVFADRSVPTKLFQQNSLCNKLWPCTNRECFPPNHSLILQPRNFSTSNDLQYVVLWYISFTGSTAVEEGDDDHPSSLWLAAIAKGTMDTYSSNILKIRSITQHASQQLATDIGKTTPQNADRSITVVSPSLLAYLCNVLAALGQSASSTLSQMEVLFKAEEEE